MLSYRKTRDLVLQPQAFFSALEGGLSGMGVPADSVFGDSTFSGTQKGPCSVLTGTNPTTRGSALMVSANPNHLPKAHLRISSPWGQGFNIKMGEEGAFSSLTACICGAP